MPLPKDVINFLISLGSADFKSLPEDYYKKLPTLGEEIFPDRITVFDISRSGSEIGKKLHALLDEAGLKKGQRAGVTHILDSLSHIGDYEPTIGDIRALNKEELLKLQSLFTWATPSQRSILIVKKLFG